MRPIKVVSAALAAVLVAVIGVLATASSADAYATQSYTWGSGTAVRAAVYDHYNMAGYKITVKGSTVCTTTYSDVDTTASHLDYGFNDSVYSAQDYNQCDTGAYQDINYGGWWTGWKNFGNGVNIYVMWGGNWDQEISSMRWT
jgi:hypothetical protein